MGSQNEQKSAAKGFWRKAGGGCNFETANSSSAQTELLGGGKGFPCRILSYKLNQVL